MITFRFKSLQQKIVVLVLIPTFLFLTAIGWGGYVFARKGLLTQWSETAIANLQKAAHRVDMRLGLPEDLLQRLQYASGAEMAHLALQYTLEQLEELEGVAEVDITWDSDTENGLHAMGGTGGKHHSAGSLEISSPVYSWEKGDQSVVLESSLIEPEHGESGSIKVEITVSDLVEELAKSEWWKSNRTMLIDMEGNVIAHSSYEAAQASEQIRSFGDSSLEKLTLAAIQEKSHGTIFGKGNPPREISGFYRLAEAPWYMVVIAPGETVMQPILDFRFYYSMLFATAIILIIAFIRSMTSTMTGSIRKISIAAENLAGGVFGPPLPVRSSDEIGELTKSFNTMTSQIRQGMELQKSMEIAREVQQNFLPGSRYKDKNIEICGVSRYCQETGGDFFDLVRYKNGPERVGAIVGDVVGHGIGAALLMASVRAMLRARNDQPGTLAEIITDVNRVLCRDTEATSNFVTLFYIAVDPRQKTMEWVRAGHDPALLLQVGDQKCTELYGKGIAMGVESSLEYESNQVATTGRDQLIVIGSDGAWEAENSRGEMFGKERIKRIIIENSRLEPEKLIELINSEIDIFLEGVPPQDDITFVVIKMMMDS
ncbi:PP2C family protein-serine/threonine phosphatase [Desulfopila inferna]|uniref:PP2C family protein-serine/threonine phosphatase n=1 Tax=Desulfopila inferna TaxID=468528 RepID=UPI001963AF4D|nr:SpoIIE family protein phosphatase [Desulfopila inferna]MBM9603809.1 SpoIIE family protein phosphatase [Desulfopila inferna]